MYQDVIDLLLRVFLSFKLSFSFSVIQRNRCCVLLFIAFSFLSFSLSFLFSLFLHSRVLLSSYSLSYNSRIAFALTLLVNRRSTLDRRTKRSHSLTAIVLNWFAVTDERYGLE
jgi:hypothetical protein